MGQNIVIAASLLLMSGCALDDDVLRLQTRAYQKVNGVALQAIFEARSGIRIELVAAAAGESGIDALQADRANLALVNNSTPFEAGVRAVLPLHDSVLHVLVQEDVEGFGLFSTLRGRRVYVANNSLAGRNVVRLVAARQGLTGDDYTLLEAFQPGATDVIIYFGPIDPANTFWYRPGFRLISLQGGDRAGVAYLLPGMRSSEIPRLTYTLPGNEETVRTLGVTTLLLARRDLDAAAIYELARTLVEQKPRFRAVAPSLFAGVTDRFDPLTLNFPLHEGARDYLERDEPNLLERYAESINLLVYLTFLALTGVVAAYRWRAHRKRERVDTFYTRALLIQKRADGNNGAELLEELNELEEEAFKLLIDGKLAADESFRILTELVSRARLELLNTRR